MNSSEAKSFSTLKTTLKTIDVNAVIVLIFVGESISII